MRQKIAVKTGFVASPDCRELKLGVLKVGESLKYFPQLCHLRLHIWYVFWVGNFQAPRAGQAMRRVLLLLRPACGDVVEFWFVGQF